MLESIVQVHPKSGIVVAGLGWQIVNKAGSNPTCAQITCNKYRKIAI